jgi:hypothetical protein
MINKISSKMKNGFILNSRDFVQENISIISNYSSVNCQQNHTKNQMQN